jgi:hypothetical protein
MGMQAYCLEVQAYYVHARSRRHIPLAHSLAAVTSQLEPHADNE